MGVRKELVVVGCALIGAAFGLSEQNGARNDAQGRADTIEACTQGIPRNAVITKALAECVESDATGNPVDPANVPVGKPVAELEAYGESQQHNADGVDIGIIARDAAIGAVVGVVLL
jgi:hypothetical protein